MLYYCHIKVLNNVILKLVWGFLSEIEQGNGTCEGAADIHTICLAAVIPLAPFLFSVHCGAQHDIQVDPQCTGGH